MKNILVYCVNSIEDEILLLKKIILMALQMKTLLETVILLLVSDKSTVIVTYLYTYFQEKCYVK